MRALISGFSYTGLPSTETEPESGRYTPVICRRMVDLPEPLGPTSP